MDTRYEHPGLAQLWEPATTIRFWALVERTVAVNQAAVGLIPDAAAVAIQNAATPTPEEVAKEEEVTRHDLAAFVNCLARNVEPEHRRWVHHGLTSSDVVDTANALRSRRATQVLVTETENLMDILIHQANLHIETLRVGRTHGQHAEPTTWGRQLKVHHARFNRALYHLAGAKVPMKLSGPVGTYAYNPPEVEAQVARPFMVPVDTDATQVVARDYYTTWAYGLVLLAAACEALAVEIRIGAQPEIDELAEPFGEGQVGSSAMPHKRNPVRAERLVGLARVARGLFQPILETTGALWGERDISNSSVERTALRDLAVLVGWMVAETADLVERLVVDPDQMEAAVRESRLPTSAAKLWLSVRAGSERDAAYRSVQEGNTGHTRKEQLSDPAYVKAWNEAAQPEWYVRNV